MTINHRIIAVALAFMSLKAASAQNEIEALRYSFHGSPATARSMGMGNAYGAVGADLSHFFTNPGGIGQYKRGGVELSFGLNDNFAHTQYVGSGADNASTRFYLNNIGLVASNQPENDDWKAFNFGVAYGKSSIFNENISIKGTSASTLMNPFSLQAYGTAPAELWDNLPFTSGLAYEAYAINPTDSTGEFYTPASTGVNNQSKTIKRSGSQGETSFGFGANYKDIFLFGMTVNFQGITFIEESSYEEEYSADQPLTVLNYKENLRTDGTGINARFGFLVKANKWLRAGAAYHTPTRITLHDLYSTTMKTSANGTNYDLTSPDLITDYSIRTPSKLLVNAAFILGKSGMLTADYEYTSFDRIKMRGSATNDYDYEAENNTISAIYRSTHTAKVGLEIRIMSYYYLRSGAIYQQNPLSSLSGELNNPFITYTGGLGYRNDTFFVDFSLSLAESQAAYYMYDPQFVSAASIDSRNTRGLLTAGIKF